MGLLSLTQFSPFSFGHPKLLDDLLRSAYGVNIFDSVFPLPCFYLTIQLIQSVYCMKGVLTRNTLSTIQLPSQQDVRSFGRFKN